MKLEEGKTYRTKVGTKTGPLVSYRSASVFNAENPGVLMFMVEGDRKNAFGRWFENGKGNGVSDIVSEWTLEPYRPDIHGPDDVKSALLQEAGSIVSGERRSTYGTPENSFGRIAKFWQAYLENRGLTLRDENGVPHALTAADVSPMMRLFKEARLCENPQHRDSFVDLIGYALTGAEVNGVSAK